MAKRLHQLAALDLGGADVDHLCTTRLDRGHDLTEILLADVHREDCHGVAGQRLEAPGESLHQGSAVVGHVVHREGASARKPALCKLRGDRRLTLVVGAETEKCVPA